ncbi:MAG: HAMP domain-containing histidine kinase [Dehalococcoidia bacterium]|nr:HAMP domain-containing histidine kinase [Dehalococcoidia bacterium]
MATSSTSRRGWSWIRVLGAVAILGGVIALTLGPIIGKNLFEVLWGVEPLTYVGAMAVILGLSLVAMSYAATRAGKGAANGAGNGAAPQPDMQQWSQITLHYFELFHHDLGRPLRRILGRERELRTLMQSEAVAQSPAVKELLAEIERQAPSFRLMMSNIQVLIQLEAPGAPDRLHPLEPAEVVRRIVDRYGAVAAEANKEITWWSEPTEFGIVYSDSSAIEHVVANLVDNSVRFATTHVEVKITKNPTHFFIRVWDDGPGIPAQYRPHLFDRGWTPEVARGEEKSSSGLGLFIARTLARRYGGELTVESVAQPDSEHHSAFLLSLPLGSSGDTTTR